MIENFRSKLRKKNTQAPSRAAHVRYKRVLKPKIRRMRSVCVLDASAVLAGCGLRVVI